jgi:hypothetical protein
MLSAFLVKSVEVGAKVGPERVDEGGRDMAVTSDRNDGSSGSVARRHTSQVGETRAGRTRKRVSACSRRGNDVVVAGLTSQVISRTIVVLSDEDATLHVLGV